MNKWFYVVGVLLIAGFAVLMVSDVQKSATPYVTTVADAMTAGDRPVQFMGRIDHKRARYDNATDCLLFDLRDEEGIPMRVRYNGVKPSNFDSADKAVVVGKCVGGEFAADKLSLKCPSKYESR